MVAGQSHTEVAPDILRQFLHGALAWTSFCLATDRRMKLDMNTADYFAIADSEGSYDEKLAAYEALAAWFNDWGTTLRSVYNKRELVQLGLRMPTRKGAEAADDPDDDGDAPADA